MQADVLNLPWQIQVALASGYIGYVVAHFGSRSDHKTHDVVFRCLVFSLVASSVFQVSKARVSGDVLPALIAVIATVFAAVIWRKWFCHFWSALLRNLDVAHSDDTLSALSAIRTKTDTELTGVSVLLNDGTWLCLDDTSEYSRSPYPAFTLGEKGDVVMYVASQTLPDGTDKALSTTKDAKFGDRLTYVPHEKVARVNMRFRRKAASRLSKAEVSAGQSPQECAAKPTLGHDQGSAE